MSIILDEDIDPQAIELYLAFTWPSSNHSPNQTNQYIKKRCVACKSSGSKGLYELSCNHVMHGSCCQKWFTSKGVKVDCPICGELPQSKEYMHCRTCGDDGHSIRTCFISKRKRRISARRNFIMKKREQLGKGDKEDQLMLSVINFDESLYNEDKQNGKCIFCGSWSAKDCRGIERFMGIQGYFKDDTDDDDIRVIYSCDK